jgi:cysteine synthase A
MRRPPAPVTSVLEAIGGTPLVELTRLAPEGYARVFVKLEYFNPTGSYKDRMAKAMIEGAERRGELRPKATVVEYTGGSTGSSLALICAVKGYPLKLVSSDAFAKEKLDTMRALGAEVILIPSDGGRITPDLIPRARAEAKRIHEEEGAFWTDQFNNSDAVEGYTGIGREIFAQLDGAPDAFVGAVGTAGMLSAFRSPSESTGSLLSNPSSPPHPGGPGAHRVREWPRDSCPPFSTGTSTTRPSPSTRPMLETWPAGSRGRRESSPAPRRA